MRWYQQLRWKLFFSHVTIILIAVVVLLLTAQFVARANLPTKQRGVGDSVTGLAPNEITAPFDQQQRFEAVVVSLFVSRRIVEPLLQLAQVSQRPFILPCLWRMTNSKDMLKFHLRPKHQSAYLEVLHRLISRTQTPREDPPPMA